MEAVILVLFVLAVIVGSGCGFVAALQIGSLSKRLTRLERRLQLQRATSPGDASPVDAEPDVPIAADAIPVNLEDRPSPSPVLPAVEVPPAAPQSVDLEAGPVKAPVPAARERPERASLEELVGGRFMGWFGAVILLGGLAYFLKYAYDHYWVGPSGRIAIGAAIGAVFVAAGHSSRLSSYGRWTDVIAGLGFAVWYLCIYFAFEVYELWGQSISFGVAAMVTATAMASAVKRDAWPVAMFALLGGYASPVLLSTGENRPVILFSWLAIVGSAAMGCAVYRRWRGINVLAFAGTALLYQMWYVEHYDPSWLAVALGGLAVFLPMFLIIPLLPVPSRSERVTAEALVLTVAGSTATALALHTLLPGPGLRLPAALLIQAVVTVAAYAATRRTEARVAHFGEAAALATLAASVAVGLAMPPIVWALQAAVLAAIALDRRGSLAPCGAAVAAVAAAMALVSRLPMHAGSFTPFLNAAFGSWVLVAIILGATAVLASRRTARNPDRQRILLGVLGAVGAILFSSGVHLEITEWSHLRAETIGVESARLLAASSLILGWAAMIAAAGAAARLADSDRLRLLAFVALVIGLFVAAGRAWTYLEVPPPAELLVFNLRTLAGLWLAAACVLVAVALGRREGSDAASLGAKMAGTASAVVLAIVLHGDVGLYWAARGPLGAEAVRSWLVLWGLLVAAATLLCRARKSISPWLPVSAHAFALLLLLTSFLEYSTAPSLLFLNPDFGARALLGASLLTSAWWLGKRDDLKAAPAAFLRGSEVCTHVLLAVAIGVDVHHWTGTAATTLPMFGDTDRQFGVGLMSALWSAYALALVVSGLLRDDKPRRVLGLIFFGVVVAKVLLIDTTSLPRVHRILSFIATGLLLIVGSYLYQRVGRTLDLGRRAPVTPAPR